MMMEEEDLEARGFNKEVYNKWLTEDFMLNEIERTPNQEEKLQKMYEYLQLLKEYDEELGLE